MRAGGRACVSDRHVQVELHADARVLAPIGATVGNSFGHKALLALGSEVNVLRGREPEEVQHPLAVVRENGEDRRTLLTAVGRKAVWTLAARLVGAADAVHLIELPRPIRALHHILSIHS